MRGIFSKHLVLSAAAVLCLPTAGRAVEAEKPTARAALITCKGLIDDGLYRSIRRRTAEAIERDFDYVIYEIGTYGGLVKSADDIAKYLILEAAKKVHTVAYITSEAISAGALLSVSCRDIIMLENTTIGDCAPIQLGGKIEGVEREKQESFVRAAFNRAAEANGYPAPLLEAMVTMQTEVHRVKNLRTGQYEFFEKDRMPGEGDGYDLEKTELIVAGDEILTVTDSKALEYGISRATVKGLDGVMAFLGDRDGVSLAAAPVVLETNWSEEMVRWLNSPAVMGVLVMLAMLGVYLELSTPGVGLPGLTAVLCFTVIIGSKYLTGMANWVEVAVFMLGIMLLLVELVVLPGFGIAGVAGIICLLGGFLGMLVSNPPDRLPWPHTAMDWHLFGYGLLGLLSGIAGSVVLAALLARFIPRISFLGGLVLAPSGRVDETAAGAVSLHAPGVNVGDVGVAQATLRPAGKVVFGQSPIDCVAEGTFIQKGATVRITEIHGNRVVVKIVD